MGKLRGKRIPPEFPKAGKTSSRSSGFPFVTDRNGARTAGRKNKSRIDREHKYRLDSGSFYSFNADASIRIRDYCLLKGSRLAVLTSKSRETRIRMVMSGIGGGDDSDKGRLLVKLMESTANITKAISYLETTSNSYQLLVIIIDKLSEASDVLNK